jgi:hypothetical protein
MVSRSYKNKKPCKRWFWGYREFEIYTALPVQRVLEILNENVQPKRRLFQLKPKPFFGCVDSEEFVIINNNPYEHRVYGNIVREGEGSKLVFTMREEMGGFIGFSLLFVVADLFLFMPKDISSLIQEIPFFVPYLFVFRMFSYLLFRFDAACTRIKLLRIFA